MTRNARMTGSCYEDGRRRRGDACGAETEQEEGGKGKLTVGPGKGFFSLGCDSAGCQAIEDCHGATHDLRLRPSTRPSRRSISADFFVQG